MGKQQQHQTKTINSQPDATSPALQKSAVDSISEFQEIFGSRAASRQFRSQQPDAQAFSLSAKLGMPTIQAKPSFRGLSSELTASTTSTIQPKLTIGEPGDKYEQEADRVAQDVVQRINSPEIATRDDGEEKKIQREPAVPIYQRVTATTGTLPNLQADFETELNQARGGGEPLDKAFRAKIEPAMNADFSGVRVHTDSQADLLNQSIQAKAFTTGQDVFFEQGAYQPESQKGQELLAHELTHVIQQNPGEDSMIQRYAITAAAGAEIAEAEYGSEDGTIKFTTFSSCLGVVGRKGTKLTGVHMVLIGNDSEAVGETEAVQVAKILADSEEVSLVGDANGWAMDDGGRNFLNKLYELLPECFDNAEQKEALTGTWTVSFNGEEWEYKTG